MAKEMIKGNVELGEVVMTRTIANRCESNPLYYPELIACVERHRTCDWGDCCDEDWESNNWSLENGERIFSAYEMTDGTRLWVITERDRSATTCLDPSDY